MVENYSKIASASYSCYFRRLTFFINLIYLILDIYPLTQRIINDLNFIPIMNTLDFIIIYQIYQWIVLQNYYLNHVTSRTHLKNPSMHAIRLIGNFKCFMVLQVSLSVFIYHFDALVSLLDFIHLCLVDLIGTLPCYFIFISECFYQLLIYYLHSLIRLMLCCSSLSPLYRGVLVSFHLRLGKLDERLHLAGMVRLQSEHPIILSFNSSISVFSFRNQRILHYHSDLSHHLLFL